MKIWLNTNDLQTIQEGVLLGILNGVVLRPKDLKETKRATEKFLGNLMCEEEGSIAVPITLDTPSEMLREAQELYHFSNRLIPAIPACKEGYETLFRLSRLSIPTFATCITTAKQGFLSMQSGAKYIELWFSELQKGWEEALSIKKILDNSKEESEIVIGSLKNIDEVIRCFELGFEGVSISKNLFEQLLEETLHPSINDYRFLETV